MMILYKRFGYSFNMLWQFSCLVINPITTNNLVVDRLKLHAGGSGVRPCDCHDIRLFSGIAWCHRDLQVSQTMSL